MSDDIQDKGPTDASGKTLYFALTVISNVSGGDWTQQSKEWQKAARRCLDDIYSQLSEPTKEAS